MMNRRTATVTLVLGLLAAATSYAFVGDRINNLTFSRSVALPGVMLSAGSYSFEVLEPGVGVDIVRVWNRDRTRVFYTGITRAVDRPRHDPKRIMQFGESVGGAAPPILVWYPINAPTGHEFIYSK
jgi:hypothetical protein